jgi:hypothetical protein
MKPDEERQKRQPPPPRPDGPTFDVSTTRAAAIQSTEAQIGSGHQAATEFTKTMCERLKKLGPAPPFKTNDKSPTEGNDYATK